MALLQLKDFPVVLKTRIWRQTAGNVPMFAKLVGISEPHVYKLLEGSRKPTVEILDKLGWEFMISVPPEELLAAKPPQDGVRRGRPRGVKSIPSKKTKASNKKGPKR